MKYVLTNTFQAIISETRSTIAFIRSDGVHTALKSGAFVTLCSTFIGIFITQTTLYVSDKP